MTTFCVIPTSQKYVAEHDNQLNKRQCNLSKNCLFICRIISVGDLYVHEPNLNHHDQILSSQYYLQLLASGEVQKLQARQYRVCCHVLKNLDVRS